MRPAHSGKAHISMRRPKAIGECDRCGFWHNKVDMVKQQQWAGNSLIDTGLLVGIDCLDVPQDQYRTLILPPDPEPVTNPRPSPNTTPVPATVGLPLTVTPENQGFTQYGLGSAAFLRGLPTQAGVLARVAALSGVPTPGGLTLHVVPQTPANTTVALVPVNVTRTFLLVFNPTQMPAQISKGTATYGARGNLSIGPNEAYFWATAQGLQPVYQGAMTAVGFASLPLWAWEA